jgi:methylated-DNA-protein-cysteine methyltransferase-like protein
MITANNECRDAILACLTKVPYGKVSSYGEIAKLAGHPGKARYVAYILKNLPKESTIPWHRIINSQGKIAFPIDTDKYNEQSKRLREEGIPVPLTKSTHREFSWLQD